MAAIPMYCSACERGVPSNHITPEKTHDTAHGGCGGPVRPLERPDGAPQAFGVFARMDGRMVLQFPPRSRLSEARADAMRYIAGVELELRPLMDAPAPGVLAYMGHIEKLTDLVQMLEQQLQGQQVSDAVTIERARLVDLEADAKRLDKLETLALERGGIYLFNAAYGNSKGVRGLGLGNLRSITVERPLRDAVDQLLQNKASEACSIERYNNGNLAPKTCARCGLGPCQTGATYKEGNQS